jgi:hypothetical protein
MATSAFLVMVFCISYEKNGNFLKFLPGKSQDLAYEGTLNHVQTVALSAKGIDRNMT